MQDTSRDLPAPSTTDPWALAEPIPAAMVAAVEAVERAPDDPEGWATLEELAEQEQRPDAVEAVFGRLIERASDPAAAEALGVRALRFHDEWSDDAATLERLLRAVLRRE
ncbi:MAG: hypothetical protein EOO75_01060, partial [Myxococcales bacterium]